MDTTSLLLLITMVAAVGVAFWHDIGGDPFGVRKAEMQEMQRIKKQSDKMLELMDKNIAARKAQQRQS
ncbi:hypothetical protein [Herbaspirillum huttiense]|uniref:hypothetical protein n=1 Tax=Herbaspirillum huttiense TaxID=863372 RepID=UPI0039B02206